jgi:hypothetical protein
MKWSGLWHNSLFTRISPQYLRRYSVHRLRNASLFGQNIVVDMGCDPHISPTNCDIKLRQLVNSYQTNRYEFLEPFNLHFSNIDFNGLIWQTIQQTSEQMANYPHFLSAFSDKSYLDLFDSKDLVYLSPKATKDLEYDSNKVYIIGFGDEYQSKDVSTVRARNEKIPFRRLPLDKYVLWGKGSKDLKSSAVLSILNDVKEGMGWTQAIQRNVSQFCLKSREQIESEDKYRSLKMLKNNNKRLTRMKYISQMLAE